MGSRKYTHRVRDKREHSKQSNQKSSKTLREFSNKLIWLLFSLFAYSGYLAEVRTYLMSNFGSYTVGFADCLVVVFSLLAIVSYAMSYSKQQKKCK